MNRTSLDDIVQKSDYFGSTIGRSHDHRMSMLEMHFESSMVNFHWGRTTTRSQQTVEITTIMEV